MPSTIPKLQFSNVIWPLLFVLASLPFLALFGFTVSRFTVLSEKFIGVHFGVLSCMAYLTFLLTLLIELATSGRWRRCLKSLAWSSVILLISYLNIFLFVALDNWGHPLTHDIAGVYLKELNQVIGALPFPLWAIVLLNLVPVMAVVAACYWLAGRLHTIPLVYSGGRLMFRLLQGVAYLFPLLLVAGFLRMEWPQHLIRESFSSSFDPVLTFVYPRKLHGESFKSDGMYLAEARAAYPETTNGGKNVVVIICDALRADHLGAYGYSRPVSPFFYQRECFSAQTLEC